MPGRTFEYFTRKPIFQGYTPEGAYILRYEHKNYVFNGYIEKGKFVEAANVAFDHADYVKGLRSGRDKVYDSAAHFIIARIGVHITNSYNQEDGHVNKKADKTMHLTMTAISSNEQGREADRMYGATGHIPTINDPIKDHKGRTIDNYIYNPRHKDPDTREPLPWSWFPAEKLKPKNRNALVASIDMLKTSRTPSPEQKTAAPTKPAPIPLTSPWGSGKGKAVDPAVNQITKTLAESSIQGAVREATHAGGDSERGRTEATQGGGKPRSRSSSQKPKPTEKRYDSDGKHNPHGKYVKKNGDNDNLAQMKEG
ncbi:hypothetical protein BTUL_0057g00530 [Botrytis tulipae]|uniref:Uncharacterized protein n=1 Tax=Botrytis tulipae TaxID=87230 RepID=A0A4Z1EP96_9HELO|nr:hypothetical protein BTUL_0057g00530 [Botrytis tulipae]